jgi:glucokinase
MEEESLFFNQVLREFGANLGDFLVPLLEQTKAGAVVLGGNIANALPFFWPSLEKQIRANNADVIIKQAQLNEDASLIGAASCWQKEGESGVGSRESGVSEELKS